MLAPYRQREILEITVFSFGVMQKVQNFRANAGPFRPTLEKNLWNHFDLESSQLSKNVRNLKIRHILAFWTTLQMMHVSFFQIRLMMTGNYIFTTFSPKWQLLHTNGIRLTELLQVFSPKTLHFLKTTDSTAEWLLLKLEELLAIAEIFFATKHKLLFWSDIGQCLIT